MRLPLLLLFVLIYCCFGCSSCCCSSSFAGLQNAGSLNLIPSRVPFLFIQTRFVFHVCTRGSTVSLVASICLYYVLGNYGHARIQRGRPPTTVEPPLYLV